MTGRNATVSSDETLLNEMPEDAMAIFGKYRLFATIGSGGMAEVFLAVAQGPLGFNKLVVVKRLRPNLACDGDNFVRMFIDEARLAARLNHPNIVHTYEVGEHEGAFFIAMEYLEGQPLKKLSSMAQKGGKNLPPAVCARIVADALAGLHHAHELRDYDGKPLGVIHRDISPHNIFVTYDGTVKLVDFGIAKAALNSTHTETGMLKGKAGYMAPEQAVSSDVDRRADLFAMGVVLWELVTGTRLFAGDTVQALHKVMTMPIPLVSTVVPGLDPDLDAIVDKALRRRVEERYQTADEMRLALEGYVRKHEPRVETVDVGRLVVDLFQDVRENIRRRIETQMAVVAREPMSVPSARASGNALTMSGVRMAAGGTPPRLILDSVTSATDLHALPSPPPVPASAPPSSRRGVVLGAIGALVVVAIALFALRGRDAPPASEPAPAAAASPPAPTTSAPSSGATSVVTIVSDPVGATVRWNDRVLGAAPVTAELPAGPQTLVLTKDGYEMATAVVTAPEGGGPPTVRSVTLKPVVAAAPKGGYAARHAHVAPPPPKPTAAPAPPPPVAVAPPPAPEPAKPARPSVKIVDDNSGRPTVKIVQ